MNDYKKLLASFIEVVAFLLAAFGGFLKNVAPPLQVGASYPVGIFSFLTLITLLAVSAISRRRADPVAKRRWAIAGIVLGVLALGAGIAYLRALDNHTYPQRSELANRKICAADTYLTTDAARYRQANPGTTAEDLEQNLPDNDIWTPAGIQRAETLLLVSYLVLVLSISGAIFCLIEANISPASVNQNTQA
jgi:hypothetical protein